MQVQFQLDLLQEEFLDELRHCRSSGQKAIGCGLVRERLLTSKPDLGDQYRKAHLLDRRAGVGFLVHMASCTMLVSRDSKSSSTGKDGYTPQIDWVVFIRITDGIYAFCQGGLQHGGMFHKASGPFKATRTRQ